MNNMLPMANLSPKWKEVLGFDIGGPRQERLFKTSTSHRRQDFYQLTTDAFSTTSSASPSKILSYPRFPREMIFFHRKNEILISAFPSSSTPSSSPTFSTPQSLFCISLSNEITSHTGRPDITLHAGADRASMVTCFAKLSSSSPIVHITLCPPPKKSISANFSSEDLSVSLPISSLKPVTYNARPKHTKSSSIGTTTSFRSNQTKKSREPPLSQFRSERLVHVFDPHLASYKYVFSYGCEAFEWRRVKPLAHHHRHHHNDQQQQYRSRSSPAAGDSMKLIRASTGEVLVIYRQIAASHNWESEANAATAMMRFRRTESMDELAEDFDIFVVVSLVSIIERERREWCQPRSYSKYTNL